MTKQQTTRQYVEQELGIPWAKWEAMTLNERLEAQGHELSDATKAIWDTPAGPDRLAAFWAAAKEN